MSFSWQQMAEYVVAVRAWTWKCVSGPPPASESLGRLVSLSFGFFICKISVHPVARELSQGRECASGQQSAFVSSGETKVTSICDWSASRVAKHTTAP